MGKNAVSPHYFWLCLKAFYIFFCDGRMMAVLQLIGQAGSDILFTNLQNVANFS
jgi:hypothetical protein